MARTIRASGDLNPNAMRVMSLILVFIDSTRPLERLCSIAARCLTILRCSFTNAGTRDRRPGHLSVECFTGLIVGQFEHHA
jgi:hypothetical protein